MSEVDTSVRRRRGCQLSMGPEINEHHNLKSVEPTVEAELSGVIAAKAPGVSAAPLRRLLGHATEPHILFPAIGVFMLILIWGTTLNLNRVERARAEHAAAISSHEMAETYEAQVVRALREVDQTLKFVKYSYEGTGRRIPLKELKARGFLPPELLFVVSIANNKGDIVASTSSIALTNVADQDYFQSQRTTDALSVGRPRQVPGSGEWKLHFSRRLDGNDGSFGGVVMIAVDAAYFVSGYETSRLGVHGVLGILGTDGVFRVKRSGEKISAGDEVSYAAVVSAPNEAVGEGALSVSVWDGVRRYTSTRELYEMPLAVIVGLSEDEQLAGTRRDTQANLWKAFAGSVVLMFVLTVLGYLSRQLALSRQRAVQEQIDNAARVEHLAFHDSLTGLPNRSLFSNLLAKSISHAHRYDRRLAVLFLDLDRFKHINDTLGHHAGDQLLQQVAARLKACLRDSDSVARLGGDEFVVLLPELVEEQCAAIVAQKILAAVARPFTLFGQEFRVTASVGISLYPQDGLDEETLKRNADIAMYKAKEEGKNQFQFYSEKLNADSLERLALESGLRHALERSEFELHYQAKRDIGSGRITGFEALLRWQHPDLGTVAPMKFIPIAEETGLIVPIGKWVLKTACLQHIAWQKLDLPHMTMSVNLTARQFYDEGLLPDLAALLEASAMDPRLLELEITESLLMRNAEKTRGILVRLKKMGIRIAIDDFGIGYSSLSTLAQFPLDTIKIDRSFIRDVASISETMDLTGAIIALGRTLSLTVVAQGVETKEQADFLRQNACDEFQGFYLSKPLPADQIAALLSAQSAAAEDDVHPAIRV